jgi:hypothetical protein
MHHEGGVRRSRRLLAPSIGKLSAPVRTFFAGSLARYPEFVSQLRVFEPELRLIEGLLDVSTQRGTGVGDRLSSAQVEATDPGVVAPHGAVFHASDAAIDNRLLVPRFGALWGHFPV